jgi:hypothetical protein
VGALAALAALRVWLFSAAFPFFTNVDEHKHVDVVLKYARGQLPRPGSDAFEPETGLLLGILGSPEYQLGPGRPPPPPAWRRPAEQMLAKVERDQAFLAARANKETFQPPAYYAIAAAWMALGRSLGLESGALLYWVRGLGGLATLALVVLSWLGLRSVAPDVALLRLGVPLLVAVFPLDAVFYVTRDALSPLLGGAVFLLAIRLARAPEAPAGAYAATGLLAALACLTKYTNVALFGACAVSSVRALRAREAGPGRGSRVLLLWVLALAPLGLWLLRNQLLFGDPTATALKARRLGWQPKPWRLWLDHPLFTPAGAVAFLGGLVPKFWRGELVWHREVLAWKPADWLYTLTSLGFVPLAAAAWWRRRAAHPEESAALAVVVLAVGCLVALSLLYVFPERGNPSAARPWFDHGRLIAGALIPFLLLYVRGLQVATSWLPPRAASRAAWCILVGVAGVALLSELALTRPVFLSAYNAYHLP